MSRAYRKNGKTYRRDGKLVRGEDGGPCCCGSATPATCCNGGGCCWAHDATLDILFERKQYTVEVAGDHVSDLLSQAYAITDQVGTRFSLTGLTNDAATLGNDFCGAFSIASGAFESWLDHGSGFEWVAQSPVLISVNGAVGTQLDNTEGNVAGADNYDGSSANFDLFAEGDPVHRCCGIALHERTFVASAFYDDELDMTFGVITYQKNRVVIHNNRCCNCSASCSPTSDGSVSTCNEAGDNYCTPEQAANCCLMTCAASPSAVAVDILDAATWAACAGAVAPMTLGSWDGTLPRTCIQDGSGTLTSLNYTKTMNIVTDSTGDSFGTVSVTWLKDDCKFRLRYACGATVIWEGEKATALNGPLGTYTRTAGTDPTLTRSVT